MALPGGNYTAIQAADGTWTILDVPFMAVGKVATYNAAGERVGEHDFDRPWLERAIDIARVKRSEAFLARVFIDHHEGDGSQEGAGYLMPTRVGSVRMNDEDIDALFGDLLHVPWHAYHRIKEGDLPYRSFESFNPAGGFVSGLALMPTMPPRFDLPMLTIGTEIPWVEPCEPGSVPHGTESPVEADMGLVACASKTQAVSAHRRGPRMPKPADTTIEPEATAFAPPPAAKAKDGDEPKRKVEDDIDESADKPDEGESKGGDDGGTEDATKDTDGTPATVESVMRTVRGFKGTPEEVQALLAEMVAFLHEMSGDESKEEGPPEQERAAAKEPRAMSNAEKEAIAAQAKADLAMGKVEVLMAERDMDRAVAKAAAELREYPLGADPEKTLRAVGESKGIAGLETYVEAVKAHGTKSPGTGEDETADASLPDLPDDISASGSPDVQAKAIAAAREYDQSAAAGWPMGDRDRFIRRKVQGRSTPLVGGK